MNYLKQKEAVISIFNKTLELEDVKQNNDYTNRLKLVKKKIIEEKIILVVAGEFKRGKSSLINALLNEDDCSLFPVDADITTNLVSTITFGKKEEIHISVTDHGKDDTFTIPRNKIIDYVTEQKNEGNAKKAKLLNIQTPNPMLNDGLTIVDTPGVAINPEHTAITYSFIPNADLILYTTDIQAPLSDTEIEFIKKIYLYCKNIIFVVTKKDLVVDSNSIITANRQKLVQVLNEKPENIKMVAVSSLNKLSYLKSKDKEDLEDSNFKELEVMIEDMVKTKRAELTLIPALNIAGEVLLNIKTPLVNLWNTCQQENKSQAETKQKEFESIVQMKQKLLEDNSDWITILSNGILRIKYDSNQDVSDGIADIQRKFEDYIDIPANAKNPEKVIAYVEELYDHFMIDMTTKNNQKINNLAEEIVGKTSMTINEVPYETSGFSFKDEDRVIDVKATGIFSKSITAVRMSTFNGTAGATIGATIGGALGLLTGGTLSLPLAVWGATIGGTLGEILGVKEGLKSVHDKDKAAVRSKVIPLLNNASSSCKNTISKQMMEVEITLRDELKKNIKNQKELYEKMLSDLKEASNMSASEMAAKLKELEIKIKAINIIFREFETVINDIKNPADTQEKTTDKKAASTEQESVRYAWAD